MDAYNTVALVYLTFTQNRNKLLAKTIYLHQSIYQNHQIQILQFFIYTSTPRPRMSRESEELEEKKEAKKRFSSNPKTYTAKNLHKSLPGISQDTSAMSCYESGSRTCLDQCTFYSGLLDHGVPAGMHVLPRRRGRETCLGLRLRWLGCSLATSPTHTL